jgi:chromosome segregation ATPase
MEKLNLKYQYEANE